MLIHNILGIACDENVYFVEESYTSLKSNILSLQYLRNILKDADADIEGIVDENNNITGIVLNSSESEDCGAFHAIFTNIVSSRLEESGREFAQLLQNLKINNIHPTTLSQFKDAVIEYYSIALVNRQLCENCISSKEPYEMVYIESRNSRLKAILDRFKLKGDILEICCGNGMSTLPMHKMGYHPLAIDYDRCQICQGLEHKVLDPKRTIVMDATRLSEYFKENSFDTIAGFMLGTIYPFNKDIWEKIISEASRVLKPGGMMILTVNKKEEMDILQDALIKNRISGNMIDNTDDKGIYDQWVFVGNKLQN